MRTWRTTGLLLGALALLCGCSEEEPAGADAVWTVADRIDADTTTFTVMVRRVGCNGGSTGEVQEPEVEVGEDRVSISFTVLPVPSAASCPSNDEVAYEVELPEPVADRALVDGGCDEGRDGSGTTWCRPDKVRWRPR